jgi:hypothetical protein
MLRSMRDLSPPVRVALGAVALAVAILAAILLSGSLSPVDLLAPARDGQGGEIMVEDFGPEAIRDGDPFDGQYIYVTARLLPDLDQIADVITESSYRLPRILHPLLASPGGSGNAVVFLLLLWNLVGLGLLTWGMADLLHRYGFPASWAMAAPAAAALALLLTTSEPLAFGLGMAGLALADRGKLVPATALFALGGLTRESALTIAVAAAAVLWLEHGRRWAAVAMVAVATLPTALWWAYVQTITEKSKVPLQPMGILRIGEQWGPNVVAAVLALVLMVVAVVAWWDVPPFRWLALAFAAWIPIYEDVAFKIVGLPRLSIPSIALGIAGIVRWRARHRTPGEPVVVAAG